MSRDCLLIIPALNPPRVLIEYVKELTSSGFDAICIVDDGSAKEYAAVFEELEKLKECHVLRHAVNCGKGRALKTAFNYCLIQKERMYSGVITLDSDGQHLVGDVIRIADQLSGRVNTIVLGSRNFTLENIPGKSRFGNRLTSQVFRLLYGKKLSDTQTGLRGISIDLLPELVALQGERFEYETNMLICAVHEKVRIIQTPIQTVYENNNKGTHFDPVRDSLRIYRILLGQFLGYIISSLSSFLLDFFLFELIFRLAKGTVGNYAIAIATCVARVFSSLFNYTVNRNVVFKDKKNVKRTLLQYYTLVIVQMCFSALLVFVLYQGMHIHEGIAKITVDTILFLISYQIQKKVIFSKK